MKEPILYVDDEDINLRVFSLTFKNEFEVLTATSAKEAIHILDEKPEIKQVISDYKMPETNGFEFIQNANQRFKNKQYFMLLGFDPSPEIDLAITSGLIKNYFTKPMNKNAILMALRPE